MCIYYNECCITALYIFCISKIMHWKLSGTIATISILKDKNFMDNEKDYSFLKSNIQ